MNKYNVAFDYGRYCIRPIDPNDSWDIGESGMNVTIKGISHSPPYNDYNYQVVNTRDGFSVGETVYLVWVKYETGSTFGSDETFELLEVFETPAEAQELKTYIECNTSDKFKFSVGGREYYASWNGYFEHLQEVNIEQLVMGK